MKMTRPATAEDFQEFFKSCEGYDKVMEKVTFIKTEDGNCTAELTVDDEHLNPMKGLHGGFSATLIDVVTSCGLMTHQKSLGIPSLSVDLQVTYLKGATKGDEIIIEAKTLRCGNTLAFLECEIRNKSSGELLVKGGQTKYILWPKD